MGDVENLVSQPIISIFNRDNYLQESEEQIQILRYINENHLYPQNSAELLDSAFRQKLIVRRSYNNTTKNTSDFVLEYTTTSPPLKKRYIQYVQEYLFKIERSPLAQELNWDEGLHADGTSQTQLSIQNRTKKTFAILPVKAHAKGTSRIFQNMAIGPGVKLYAKIRGSEPHDTTLSGMVIATSS